MVGRGVLVALAGLALAGSPANAQSMIGQWQGVGLQVNPDGREQTWDIRLTLRADIDSRVEYPSLSCKGELKAVSRKPDTIEFEEKITSGVCEDGGRLLLTLRGGRLGFFWWKLGSPVDASAVLHRSAGQS
jgi:hypothetical protein